MAAQHDKHFITFGIAIGALLAVFAALSQVDTAPRKRPSSPDHSA